MRSLDEVLEVLAVPGVDHDDVCDYLAGALEARRRRIRHSIVGALAAAAVLIAGFAVVSRDSSHGDDVVADRMPSEERETTTSSSTTPIDTAVVAAETSTSVAVSTSLPYVTTTIRPGGNVSLGGPPIAPLPAPVTSTTTTMADQPPQAAIIALSTQPVVGDVATFRIAWSDPDLPAGTEPSVYLQTGDPAVVTPASATATGACSPGEARTGVVDRATRFSRAGTYTVSVLVSACGQTALATTTVTVGEPAAGRSVVITSASSELKPEQGSLAYSETPGDPSSWVAVPPRDPTLDLWHDGYPATVIVLDPTMAATMRLQFGSCSLEAPFDLSTVAPGATARIHVPGTC